MTTPLHQHPTGSEPLATLSPNEHLKMLLELLQPAGADLSRRWLSALMLVPREEREQVVARIERRIHEVYGGMRFVSGGNGVADRGVRNGDVEVKPDDSQPGPSKNAVHAMKGDAEDAAPPGRKARRK